MKSIRIASLIGYAATAAVVFAVPVIMVHSGSRSEYFWWKILWAEVLALLVWGFLGGFFSYFLSGNKDSQDGIAGVIPALGSVIFLYSGISLILMLGHAWLPKKEIYDNLHLVAQIVILAGSAVICVFLYYAKSGASAGAPVFPAGVPSPFVLVALLKTAEDQFRSSGLADLKESTKSLKEKINYVLASAGRINAMDEYIEFTQKVRAFCDRAINMDRETAGAEEEKMLAKESKSLLIMAETIIRSTKSA